ncbi:MAG: Gfo/Idh/MocA family oxidoreductase [Chloroflexota bacterium]
MKNGKMNVGVIGCGNISSIYLEVGKTFDILNMAACADLDLSRAEAQAAKYGIPKAYSVEELLADPEIDLVLNLTVPKAHAEIAMAAINAGKSVYNEKPLAVTREDGKAILNAAKARGVRVGGAPDTFLGGGLQTCRKVIDDGAIGQPVAATAFWTSHGHESWHPDPGFYYQAGGGPMFDMGPYYVTALITLLGPVRRVTGSTQISSPERTITSEPKRGQKIAVETPTHVTGILDFVSGPIATIITSFDVWAANLPRIEIYGTEGSLSVPDPNIFDGPVRLRRAGEHHWSDVPLTHGYTRNSRSIGVADMAYAQRNGKPHRASGELVYHVLDTMQAIYDSSQLGQHIELTSTCQRPEPLPEGSTEAALWSSN